jgi:hypothetical protein
MVELLNEHKSMGAIAKAERCVWQSLESSRIPSKHEGASEASSPKESAAMIAVFAMDIGWVSLCPTVGLPATAFAMFLQASVVSDAIHAGGFELAHSLTVFMWVVGNAVWMCCEFLWDEERPEGVLANFPSLASLDRAYFPDLLGVSSIITWITAFSLAGFYANQTLAAWPRRKFGLEGLGFPNFHREDNAFGVPLHIYQDIFVLPWILSDSCWLVCNRRYALGLEPGLVSPIGLILGVAAVGLVTDALRRYAAVGRFREALQCSAELLWVGGNLAWFSADMRNEETAAARNLFTAMFVVGLCIVVGLAATPVMPTSEFEGRGLADSEKRWLLKGVVV